MLVLCSLRSTAHLAVFAGFLESPGLLQIRIHVFTGCLRLLKHCNCADVWEGVSATRKNPVLKSVLHLCKVKKSPDASDSVLSKISAPLKNRNPNTSKKAANRQPASSQNQKSPEQAISDIGVDIERANTSNAQWSEVLQQRPRKDQHRFQSALVLFVWYRLCSPLQAWCLRVSTPRG